MLDPMSPECESRYLGRGPTVSQRYLLGVADASTNKMTFWLVLISGSGLLSLLPRLRWPIERFEGSDGWSEGKQEKVMRN